MNPIASLPRRIAATCVAVAFAGCSVLFPRNLPADDTIRSSDEEGIVVGSLLLTVEEKGSEHSYYGYEASSWLSDFSSIENLGRTFTLRGQQKSTGGRRHGFVVEGTGGEETYFILKLPAGEYEVSALDADALAPGSDPEAARMTLLMSFSVRPRTTAYIGRLSIVLPFLRSSTSFNEGGGGSGTGVWDAEAETLSGLRDRFPATLASVTKQLATQRSSITTILLERDCIPVNRMLFEGHATGTDPEAEVRRFCAQMVAECADRPGGDECRKLVQRYDARRFGAGISALMGASGTKDPGEESGNTPLVRFLLNIGFDPDARTGGPLPDDVLDLIAPGYAARSSGSGWRDLTPLMIAARMGDLQIVRMLLRAGAETQTRNDQGQTALSMAEAGGHADVARALRERGASP